CMRRVLQPFAIEPINPFAAEMQANIKALGGNGLGLLDAEGAGKELSTCLESSGMDPSEENRQKWREFCYGLENLGEYCSAVLMEEEALKFTSSAGRTLPQILSDAGVESSMRVDQGFVPLNSFGEKATEGIVLLEERCEDFYASGVRIAKWRTQVECNLEMPTDVSVWENTDCLARAARVCQAGHGRTGRTGSQGSHALPGGRQNMKPMFHLASPVQNLTESRLAL
ncbi:Fructose-bisphosphate aldolase (ALDO), partial [Durusdinium trenchii]